MKKSIVILAAAAVFSLGITVYGWLFIESQVGEATLTEKTATGDIEVTDGLEISFRADSQDNLHWINSFDYSTGKTESHFKRGKMDVAEDNPIYDDIKFTGYSDAPYFIHLKYDSLMGLQDKKIHSLYDETAQRALESGEEEKGKIRLKEYLDFYPVSFSFQLGNKVLSSENALTGLKVYDEKGKLLPENAKAYDEDIYLYVTLNDIFKIPVIENEYQEYTVKKAVDYDKRASLPYEVEIEKPMGDGEDFYEFAPIIVVQEENVIDGKEWEHPDLSKTLSAEAVTDDKEDDADDDSNYAGKKASEYNLKNRMLFAVNNRTAKGAPIDISQIRDGYGIYELPIELSATATIKRGRRSMSVPNPQPLPDKLRMVYPLDTEAEYVEMSLSDDHRYLAVFSVKDGNYLVDIVDTDTWKSQGIFEMFPASEKMSYVWGKDGSLAVTDNDDNIVIFERTEDLNSTYKVLYKGEIEGNFDEAFFGDDMLAKENSYSAFKYNEAKGLSVTVKDGKAALVQNLLVGSGENSIRTPALECAVIDENGAVYRGRLESSITDIDYDMTDDEVKEIGDILKNTAKEQVKIAKHMITPVRNENSAEWKD